MEGVGKEWRRDGGYPFCGRRLLVFSAMGAALATVSGRSHAGGKRTLQAGGDGVCAHVQGEGRSDLSNIRTRMCAAHARQPKPGQAQKMGHARQTGMKEGVTRHMSAIKVRLSPYARVYVCIRAGKQLGACTAASLI